MEQQEENKEKPAGAKTATTSQAGNHKRKPRHIQMPKPGPDHSRSRCRRIRTLNTNRPLIHNHNLLPTPSLYNKRSTVGTAVYPTIDSRLILAGTVFDVNQANYRSRRFQYGGYSFGFVGAWPSNWLYTQDVYVVDIDGVYYLCNAMYPGVNIALNVTL